MENPFDLTLQELILGLNSARSLQLIENMSMKHTINSLWGGLSNKWHSNVRLQMVKVKMEH